MGICWGAITWFDRETIWFGWYDTAAIGGGISICSTGVSAWETAGVCCGITGFWDWPDVGGPWADVVVSFVRLAAAIAVATVATVAPAEVVKVIDWFPDLLPPTESAAATFSERPVIKVLKYWWSVAMSSSMTSVLVAAVGGWLLLATTGSPLCCPPVVLSRLLGIWEVVVEGAEVDATVSWPPVKGLAVLWIDCDLKYIRICIQNTYIVLIFTFAIYVQKCTITTCYLNV